MNQTLRYPAYNLHQENRSLCFSYQNITSVIFFSLAVTILSLGFFQMALGEPNTLPREKLASILMPNGSIVVAEIADTTDKRARGLMHRTFLASDHGMLFQFPELGYWTFWMKNTKIPLDIIWLDKTGKIIHIESEVPICTRTDDSCPRYYSHQKSWQVLELKAGMAKNLHLVPGDQLKISIPHKLNSTDK